MLGALLNASPDGAKVGATVGATVALKPEPDEVESVSLEHRSQ